jgi:hypothetical protein
MTSTAFSRRPVIAEGLRTLVSQTHSFKTNTPVPRKAFFADFTINCAIRNRNCATSRREKLSMW